MMPVLHLLWIILLSVSFGYTLEAIMMATKKNDEHYCETKP